MPQPTRPPRVLGIRGTARCVLVAVHLERAGEPAASWSHPEPEVTPEAWQEAVVRLAEQELEAR